MINFFKWINNLDPLQAWGLFVLVAIILALIPYMGYFLSFLRIKFSNQKLEVLDFSWRLIPDQLFEKSKEDVKMEKIIQMKFEELINEKKEKIK